VSRTLKDDKRHKEKMCEKYNTWPYGTAPSSFKKSRRRIRRAKEKNAIKNDIELPIFKRNDSYDWY